jgi:hypothetical protein
LDLILGSDPRSGVGYFYTERQLRGVLRIRAHYHAAMRGVFHSVANADASRIHRLVIKDQCQPFYFNAWTVQLRANAEQVVQTGKTSSPAPHPRFDLRDM